MRRTWLADAPADGESHRRIRLTRDDAALKRKEAATSVPQRRRIRHDAGAAGSLQARFIIGAVSPLLNDTNVASQSVVGCRSTTRRSTRPCGARTMFMVTCCWRRNSTSRIRTSRSWRRPKVQA
jgi:hypothetical protein